MSDPIVTDVKAVGSDIKGYGTKAVAFITAMAPHIPTWVILLWGVIAKHL